MHKTRWGLVVSNPVLAATLICAALLAAPLRAQNAPSQPPPTPETIAKPASPLEVIALSPFLVSEAADQGYFSAQTLAGGRIRSELKDVATSVQIVTERMLADLGATNLNDVLAYATNTDAVSSISTFTTASDSFGDGSLDQSAARQDPASANRVRGLAAPTRTTNYFESAIPFDSYNSGRIDINRGANSFLFGLGSPGGIVNNSLAMAELTQDSIRIEYRLSTENFENNISKRGR